MHAVNFLNAKLFHHPVFDHLVTTTTAFFGRLKDHHRGSVKIPRLGQIFRRAQQHRRMSVMPASMHFTGFFGFVIKPGRFKNRQRIHIGAQANHLARDIGFAVDHPDNPGTTNPAFDLVAAKSRQFLFDNCRGAECIKQQFRVFMQITPPFGDFCV